MKQTLPYDSIRSAALALQNTSDANRDSFLTHLGAEIAHAKKRILSANAQDIRNAKSKGLPAAFIQRLVLDEKGIKLLSHKLADVRKLKSGLGEIFERRKDSRGLELMKVRVPLGVLAVIYEARPEVTIDVAALCVKSGNAAILKGGSEALSTNAALYACIARALKKSKLPAHAVTFIKTADRSVTNELLSRHDAVDLVIARGGYGMVKTIMERSTIPVLAHAAGGARIYVDKSADLKKAVNIIVNAKTTKPAACNTVDTVLIHTSVAKKFVPMVVTALQEHAVDVRGDAGAAKYADIQRATASDWSTEFLGLTISLKTVASVHEAISFIHTYTKRHTEGIVANDERVVKMFLASLDAAALFVNASTRFHDGFEFGLGSEMGISTGKLHARGPVGLKELTTYKWIVKGHGNIRI